jgi:predicted dehydrogenase
MIKSVTRRTFLGAAGAAGASASSLASAANRSGPNDRITVGMIAVGSRAQELLEAIKQVDGTEIVAVCDAYSGRMERAAGRTGGRARTHKNYQEIIADRGIDVVTVATPDHWHKTQVIEALQAGKDVYCEKPLTYAIDEGLEIAAAVKKSGKLLQVGSQGVSSQLQQKAREMIRSGKLGKVTMIRASYNRNTASGAWIYPIPPDASPETVDWQAFLGPAKKRPYNLERFFRWRCYRDYSGGIATDLFVHLCTTIHFIMDAKMPSNVVGRGELYRWKESRDVPDTLNAILEYPEGFTANLSSTFNNQFAGGQSFQILGTEGTLVIGSSKLTFVPNRGREDNRWIVEAWPQRLEQQYYRDEKVRAAELPRTQPAALLRDQEEFHETGQSSTVQHFQNFFDSVRSRKPTIEDEMAGHRAAACAHLINDSSENDRITHWDFKREGQRA